MLSTAVVAGDTTYCAEESAITAAPVESTDEVLELLLLSEEDVGSSELEPPQAASVHASAHNAVRSTTFIDINASPSSCKSPRAHSSVEVKEPQSVCLRRLVANR